MRASILTVVLLASVCMAQRSAAQTAPLRGGAPELGSKVAPDFFQFQPGWVEGEASGVAVNSKGHIFLFRRTKPMLSAFDELGRFIRSFGEGLFDQPHGVRIDGEDNLWTTDDTNHLVLKLSPAGKVPLVLGRQFTGGEANWLFNKPADIALAKNGDIYVADGYGNSRVVTFDRNGNFIKAWGKYGTGPGEFNLPHSVVVDREGRVYVGDRENARNQVFDADGNFLTQWTGTGYPLAAADQDHSHGDESLSSPNTLGKVTFPISCKPSVQKPFERAVAMLHSFWYEASLEAFQKIVAEDPDCAMGYWGIAMSEWHPLWYAPDATALQAGWGAIEKAKAAGSKSNRERGFVDALESFYRDGEKLDNATRVAAYEKAVEQLHDRFPDDREVTAFYGLALITAASPKDKTYAKQKKAAVLLQQVFTAQPDHPGASHYIIHSFDYPELAELGLPAARNYSKIAPAAPHALHMPSHIFTRLGLWRDSIASNISSERAAKEYEAKVKMDGAWDQQLHAMDYLAYAYLQLGQDRDAKAVLDELRTIKKVQPENIVTAYAFAALPARYALERRNWAEAAAITSLHESKLKWPSGLTAFTRGYGLARLGDLTGARRELAVLETIEHEMARPKDPFWSDYIEALRRGLQAWIAHSEEREPEALALMRSAADLEDATDKHPVTPCSMLPMRELLGELLLEQLDGKQALVEYETALRRAPHRLAALYGAARAAEAAGDAAKAKSYYAQMVEQCSRADGDRAEIKQARAHRAQ